MVFQKVIKMLDNLQLPLENILFQCYDTTTSMSGAYNRAQATFSEHLWWTITYITCLGHKTNLFVERSCKASLMVHGFFSTLQEIYNFLMKSTGCFGKLRSGIQMLQEGLSSLGLCGSVMKY